MAIFNFIQAETRVNNPKERVILWHTGNYKYQLERKQGDKTVSKSDYVNTSYEQALEIFNRIVNH